MSVQYLYDSSGNWIAFRVGVNIYSENGTWIGWMPWDDNEVVTTEGDYLGHIFPGNRLYKKYVP